MNVVNVSASYYRQWIRICVAIFLVTISTFAHAQSIILSETTRVTLQSSSDDAARTVLTASVSTNSGVGVPAGTIRFIDETTMAMLGWADVAKPIIVVDRLNAGQHRIRADYSGTSGFLPVVVQPAQSAVLVINIKGAPDVSVSSSNNPSVAGELVTLTAMVTCRDVAPNGTVTFRDGAQVLAAHVGLDHAGAASFTTSALADGSRVITVEYEGDRAHARMLSPRLVQDVGDVRFRSSQLR